MTAPAHPHRRCAAALALLTLLALTACGPRAASEPATSAAPSVDTPTPAAHETTGHDMADMNHGTLNPGNDPQGATPAVPANAAPLPLTATDGRVVAVPPGVQDTSVFATLTNTGPDDIQLSGVSSPAATGGLLMITRTDPAGLTGMSAVNTLTVPAGGTLTLSDTGDHLMLSGLKAPLQEGERLSLTLTDTQGRALTLDLPVLKP